MINTLDKNIAWRCLHYQYKIKEIFQKNPREVKNPAPEDFRRKTQTLLADIGGTWYLNDTKNPKNPIKRPKTTKK